MEYLFLITGIAIGLVIDNVKIKSKTHKAQEKVDKFVKSVKKLKKNNTIESIKFKG